MKRSEARAKIEAKSRLYEAVFSSPDGKRVLADLNREFGHSTLKKNRDGNVDPHASIAAAGSREVLVYIEDMRNRTNATAE